MSEKFGGIDNAWIADSSSAVSVLYYTPWSRSSTSSREKSAIRVVKSELSEGLRKPAERGELARRPRDLRGHSTDSGPANPARRLTEPASSIPAGGLSE